MGVCIRSIWGCFVVLVGTSVLAQQPSRTNVPEAPADVVFEKDIAYRKGHERWMLNVVRPREDSKELRAAIVLVHGGGWLGGDHYRFSRMGFMLAQKGYVVVLPTYRMIPDAPFPACLRDVKDAISWLRANAKTYGVDPDRIGAYGNSAGGTLALQVAMTANERDLQGEGPHREHSSALQAVVCSGAVGDMRHEKHSRRAVQVYRGLGGSRVPGTTNEQIDETMRRASPITYVRKDVPPILLVHGAKDPVVFVDSTDEFYERMKAVGAPIRYLRFDDAGHAVMGEKGRTTNPAMLEFFEMHLRGGDAQPR